MGGRLSALLVAGSPEPSSPALVRALAARSDLVVGVDRGADACRAAGVACDLFVGDADTISPEALAWVRRACPEGATFDTEKYATDLALAFLALRERLGIARAGTAELRASGELAAPGAPGEGDAAAAPAPGDAPALAPVGVTCASGGRPDHLLGVFGTLAENADLSPVLAEDGFRCHVLSPAGSPSWRIGAEHAGATFSALAIAPGTCVSERGMTWELDRRALPVLSDLGVSNVIGPEGAVVTCHSGVVAAFLR